MGIAGRLAIAALRLRSCLLIAAARPCANNQAAGTGWNVGAGLSYALDQHWSIGIEGDYFRLGDKALTASDPITGAVLATSTAHYRIFEQKFGVSYRF